MTSTIRQPLVLFYNPFFHRWPDTGDIEGCRFTTDRAALAQADAVIFHLPSCEAIWAAPKYPGQLWIAASMESDASYPDQADPAFMRAFDLTMTHRRSSDAWSPYLSLARADELSAPAPVKTASAPAVLFLSAPQDRCGRLAYLTELMAHLPVDSYGKVLHNRDLDTPDQGRWSKVETVRRYKFCLAFENSIEPDYVTEKFFQALAAGAVPVYRGAPNIRDFWPGAECGIDAADFAGPAELAAYLQALDQDDAAYRRYHAWRAQGVSESFRRVFAPTARPALARLCDLILARADPLPGPRGVPTRPLAWRQWLGRTADGGHAPVLPG
jgi:alpha-1,3-fucosyltransferase 10